MNDQALKQTADSLMRAVVNSGAIRRGNDSDITLGSKVMREELKSFLYADDPKYDDERELTKTGQSGLAMMSLTAECIRRVIAERTA